MPSIGDIANDIARTLYEVRIPVAIASVALAIALAAAAHRLGWIAAARRHPGRSAVALVVALAIALPTGWYLGSPIFIRTSLVEDLPTVSPAPVASPSPDSTAAPSATGAPTAPSSPPTPTPFVPATVASGEFVGTDEFHFGSGTASIVEIAPGRYHLRLDDFSVRNGPDLYVYLSPDPDGYEDAAVEIGVLKATDGSFGYDLPDGTDPDRYRSALIWCKQFSHLFAVATFDR
ncbi:MAG: DM13 domain-containing protein [Chloroflexota bacterium]